MGYRPRHRAGEKRIRRSTLIIRICIALILAVLIAVPLISPLLLQTETVSLVSSDLPDDVKTLRIVYLSDIHQGFFFSQSRVNSLVDKVNALNPDLILLGGDYANSSDEAIDFFHNLPSFRARYAVCAVLGECDRTMPESNLGLLKAAMVSAGVTPLVNEVVQIRIGSGSSIYVAGVDDVTNGSPDLSGVAAQVKQSDYVIFMCHNPSIIGDALRATGSDNQRNWYDLGLFGHTHGGQIGLFPGLLGISNVASRYQSGWIQENRIDMLISNGVGTSKLPIRLFCTPQIHLITVRKGS